MSILQIIGVVAIATSAPQAEMAPIETEVTCENVLQFYTDVEADYKNPARVQVIELLKQKRSTSDFTRSDADTLFLLHLQTAELITFLAGLEHKMFTCSNQKEDGKIPLDPSPTT